MYGNARDAGNAGDVATDKKNADDNETTNIANHTNIIRIASEMKEAGIDRAIWGIFFNADIPTIEYLKNKAGYLVTKYDNYADVLSSDTARLIPAQRIEACDYTKRRMKNWPCDIRTGRDGSMSKAWALKGTDGMMYNQYKMCIGTVLRYFRDEVKEDIEKHNYNARFIDVMGTGADECSNQAHPVSRMQSVSERLAVLGYLGDIGVIAGTEDGFEDILPAIAYNEGMMSPSVFRAVDSGRRKAVLYRGSDIPSSIPGFMLNPLYRVPLWELVYHDCVISYWYWGDSSNCCPELIKSRDLFNTLYGTPPLYSFKTSDWDRLKESIIASYKYSKAASARLGFAEMTSFEYLTFDKKVQKTEFCNGISVIANFGSEPFKINDNIIINSMDSRIVRC